MLSQRYIYQYICQPTKFLILKKFEYFSIYMYWSTSKNLIFKPHIAGVKEFVRVMPEKKNKKNWGGKMQFQEMFKGIDEKTYFRGSLVLPNLLVSINCFVLFFWLKSQLYPAGRRILVGKWLPNFFSLLHYSRKPSFQLFYFYFLN